jgi:hypothetical protein
MQTELIPVKSGKIDPDFWKKVKAAFRIEPLTPDVSPREAYYQAGQASVIDYIEKHLTRRGVSGDPEDI